VTKQYPVVDVVAAVLAGLGDVAENRAQDLVSKASDALWESATAPAAPAWHMIGQCQSNKVATLAPHVTLWQSVDRVEVIERIARRAEGAAVLIQVDLTDSWGNPERGGAVPSDLARLVDVATSHGLDVRGLMAVAPLGGDPRPGFDLVRERASSLGLAECSIGMSNDFEIAVEHGSTMVRIGRAIFDATLEGAVTARR
jgi:uncharacterized pyridoxal phosphate-containing UPF0001 family protein